MNSSSPLKNLECLVHSGSTKSEAIKCTNAVVEESQLLVTINSLEKIEVALEVLAEQEPSKVDKFTLSSWTFTYKNDDDDDDSELQLTFRGPHLQSLFSYLQQYHFAKAQQQAIDPKHFYNLIPKPKKKDKLHKLFALQQTAIDAMDNKDNNDNDDDENNGNDNEEDEKYSGTKLYCFESKLEGKRRFWVAQWESFIDSYYSCPPLERHVYEIIRENYPCRLYFDLEFQRLLNPNTDGAYLCELWLNLVCTKLYELYNVYIGKNQIVMLDSSTNKKFSRHVIIHIYRSDILSITTTSTSSSNTSSRNNKRKLSQVSSQKLQQSQQEIWSPSHELLFQNNLHCGYFVDVLMRDITTPVDANDSYGNGPRQPRPEFKALWLNSDKGDDCQSCIVDTCVYTRNRAFRLPLSSKHGKAAVLREVEGYRSFDDGTGNRSDLSGSDGTEAGNRKARISNLVKRSLITPPCPSPTPRLTVIPGPAGIYNNYRISCNTLINGILKGSNSHGYISSSQYISDNGSGTNTRTTTTRSTGGGGWKSGPNRKIIASNRIPLLASLPLSVSSTAIDPHSTGIGVRSPFTKVDELVLDLCSAAITGGPDGYISEWSLYIMQDTRNIPQTTPNHTPQTTPNRPKPPPNFRLRYLISRNRFCRNINRCHKSNGIYFEIDLNSRLLRQRCWDMECGGFRSDAVRIPDDSVPSLQELIVLDEEQDLLSALKAAPEAWAALSGTTVSSATPSTTPNKATPTPLKTLYSTPNTPIRASQAIKENYTNSSIGYHNSRTSGNGNNIKPLGINLDLHRN